MGPLLVIPQLRLARRALCQRRDMGPSHPNNMKLMHSLYCGARGQCHPLPRLRPSAQAEANETSGISNADRSASLMALAFPGLKVRKVLAKNLAAAILPA